MTKGGPAAATAARYSLAMKRSPTNEPLAAAELFRLPTRYMTKASPDRTEVGYYDNRSGRI